MIEVLFVTQGARRQAERVAPGDALAADRAEQAALRAVAGGASVGEALVEARRYTRSWVRGRRTAA
jgi:hypothetical protein